MVRVALALLLLLASASPAFAVEGTTQCPVNTNQTGGPCIDEGHADAVARASIQMWADQNYPGGSPMIRFCNKSVQNQETTQRIWELRVAASGVNCTTSTTSRSISRYYPTALSCATRSDEDGWAHETAGAKVCDTGCAYETVLDTDASGGMMFSPTGAVCYAGEFPDPVPDTDGDGEPDSTDDFPEDPNEQTDTDGDGIGDNADFAPEDPTDGKDTPGEEDGDDEGDNAASGGGDCNAPPSCVGDGIQCAQLFQQWKIVCKGATVTGSPEVCSASYTCNGDSAQCAQIALLRKSACATEASTGANGDANNNGQPDWTEGAEPGRDEAGADDDVTDLGLMLSPSMLDTENIFGGGTCQNFSVTIYGQTISTSQIPQWCQIVAIMRAVVLLMGAFWALRLLMGGL